MHDLLYAETMKQKRFRPGFTVVELLLVAVTIGILAAIVIVTYNGVQERAADAKRHSDLSNLAHAIETYKTFNGTYPQTTSASPANWHSTDVRTDSDCFNGTKNTDWIPGIGSLPHCRKVRQTLEAVWTGLVVVICMPAMGYLISFPPET